VTVAGICELALVKPEGEVICKSVVPVWRPTKELLLEFGLSSPRKMTGLVVMLPTGLARISHRFSS